MIKQADKGSSLVEHNKKAYRLLSDKSTYKWLAIDPLPSFHIELTSVLNKNFSEGVL